MIENDVSNIIPFLEVFLANNPDAGTPRDWVSLFKVFLSKTRIWRCWVCCDVQDPEDEEQNPVLRSLRQLLHHLLAKGVDLNDAKKERGLLELAVEDGCPLWVIRTLIKEGCDKVDACRPGKPTPLMIAVQQGRKKVVEILLAAGADVNLKESQQMESLTLAVQKKGIGS